MESNYQKFVMLGCRLGYIVRSQMGKGSVEIPDGVLISSDGYILTDCNGVYLIAAVAAEPDEPDEPGEVATMYLYGTPSESGNIGLRVGDAVIYYNGVVSPRLPEHEEGVFESAFIVFAGGLAQRYQVFFTPEITYRESESGMWHFCYADGTIYYSLYDGEWKYPQTISNGGAYGTIDSVLWSNTDLLNKDGTVGHAKSDPIPVGEIVDYINGIPIYEQKEDS